MSEHTFKKSYSQFVNALIFIFPIVINSVKVAGDIVLFILAVMGIFIAISKRLSPFSIKETKVFSYLTFGYFLAVCLSVFFSGKAMELAHFISRDLHFLFAPFIALAFYKAEINVKYVLAGIKFGLVFLGIIIINQLLSGFYRPSGVMNPDVFANLVVSMLFIAIVFYQEESFKHKIFTFLSLLSSLFVIFASGVRGALITLLLLFGAYLCFLYKQKNKSRKISIIITVFIITSVLTISSLNQSVNDRLYNAYIETSNWFSGDKPLSSVGIRLEMYSMAIDNAEDVPIFGHGYRTSNHVLFKDASSPTVRSWVAHNHLHNAYLTSLYNGGIVLLGALLLLLFFPLRIFIKSMSQNRDEPVFIAGALLVLGFVSHGMLHILFGDVFINAFYVFYLAIFLHLTAKSTKIS